MLLRMDLLLMLENWNIYEEKKIVSYPDSDLVVGPVLI